MPLETLTRSRAIERAAVTDVLRKVAPGEVATYRELDLAAGCSTRENRHIVAAARDELRDDEAMVFEPIAKVGYRRLTEAERATVAPDRRRRRAYRQATISLKEMHRLETAELTPGERQQFLGRFALLGAIAAIATHRALRRVMAVANPESARLPEVDQTLSILSGDK